MDGFPEASHSEYALPPDVSQTHNQFQIQKEQLVILSNLEPPAHQFLIFLSQYMALVYMYKVSKTLTAEERGIYTH